MASVVGMFVMKVLEVVYMVFFWLQATSATLRLPFDNLVNRFRNAEMGWGGRAGQLECTNKCQIHGQSLEEVAGNI